MDAGADVGARDLQQLLAAGGAPEGLSPVATLAVIDELLNREALWHGGHFLQQTVYSCLYMLQPARQAAAARRLPELLHALPCVRCRPPLIMDDQTTGIRPSAQGGQQSGAVSVLHSPARQRKRRAHDRADGPCVRGTRTDCEPAAQRCRRYVCQPVLHARPE